MNFCYKKSKTYKKKFFFVRGGGGGGGGRVDGITKNPN